MVDFKFFIHWELEKQIIHPSPSRISQVTKNTSSKQIQNPRQIEICIHLPDFGLFQNQELVGWSKPQILRFSSRKMQPIFNDIMHPPPLPILVTDQT